MNPPPIEPADWPQTSYAARWHTKSIIRSNNVFDMVDEFKKTVYDPIRKPERYSPRQNVNLYVKFTTLLADYRINS